MDKKEMVVNQVIITMQQVISVESLRILDNALRSALRGVQIIEECTALSTSMDDNEHMICIFEANKKLEGCKDGTVDQYVRHARNFLEDINKNYKDVNKEDIKFYLAAYSKGHKQNTVSSMKRYLSAFFAWLCDDGYINRNPVRAIKGIKPVEIENKALSIEEELSIRDASNNLSLRDKAIIDVLFSTGLRVSEIRALNRNSVDMIDGSITLQGAKNYKYRVVYLDPRAKKHLFEYMQTRTDCSEALFATERIYKTITGAKDVKRMSKQAFETVTKGIGRAAGIMDKNCTVHVFRKTFATRLADRGCPLEVIQELLGHADAGTTSKHYVAKSKNRIKKACEQYLFAA